MRQGWLSIRNQGESSAELIIDGFIGDSWDDSSNTYSRAFRSALDSIPKGTRVTVGLNSPGGAIDDGLAIFNAIRERGDVTVRVDGYALSIASLILQAGSVRVVPESALVMEHDPWSGTIGNSRDMRKSAEVLDKHRDVIADVMAGRSRRRRDAVLQAMEEETWYTGAEAVAAGLADETSKESPKFSRFDASKFRRVPTAVACYAMHSISADVPQEKPANTAEANQTRKEDMKALVAFLAAAGVVASAESNEEQAVASAKAWLDKNKSESESTSDELSKAKAALAAETKAHDDTKQAFAEAVVDRAVADGKIEDKADVRAAWAKAHVADRGVAGAQLAGIKAHVAKTALGHPENELPGAQRTEKKDPPLSRVQAAFAKQIGVTRN